MIGDRGNWCGEASPDGSIPFRAQVLDRMLTFPRGQRADLLRIQGDLICLDVRGRSVVEPAGSTNADWRGLEKLLNAEKGLVN